MEVQAPSRRERLRAEASQEIKTIALKLMTEGGPAAISLRAIARDDLVALEVYGHLRPQVRDPAKLYRAELHDLTTTLGLTPPTRRPM